MRLIKSFQITILLIVLIRCDIILQDYGNGNRGAGINDRVKGKNNTWIGNTNNINGDTNKVIGDDNKISGSNNIVQGSGNVVGDISPEELAKLQNQMFASFQDKFKGMFNFGSPSQPQNTQKPQQDNKNLSRNQENKTEEATNNLGQVSKQVPVKTAEIAYEAQPRKKETIVPQDRHMPSRENGLMLVFRSFGKQLSQMINEKFDRFQTIDIVRKMELLSKQKQKSSLVLYISISYYF